MRSGRPCARALRAALALLLLHTVSGASIGRASSVGASGSARAAPHVHRAAQAAGGVALGLPHALAGRGDTGQRVPQAQSAALARREYLALPPLTGAPGRPHGRPSPAAGRLLLQEEFSATVTDPDARYGGRVSAADLGLLESVSQDEVQPARCLCRHPCMTPQSW